MKELNSRYRAERRPAVLQRVRVSAAAVAALGLVTSPIVLLSAPDNLAREIAHTVFTFTVSLLAALLARSVVPVRHAIPFAVGTVLLLAASLLWRGPLDPGNPGQFAGAVGMVMIGAALLVPWGAVAQAFVSFVLSAAFLALPRAEVMPQEIAVDAVRMLATSVVLSLLGAWLLDHQRYRTFVESEHARDLARAQDVLVGAGQALSRVLEERELFPEIVRVARDLVRCDQASLTLLSDDSLTSRVVAINAHRPLRIQEMLNVDVPLPPEFLAELGKATVAEVPGESQLFNEGTYPVMRRFGVGRSLFVVLRSGERILGYVNLDNTRSDPPFTPEQKRAAESLAHQVGTAVTNARLVRDLRVANRTKLDFLSTMSHELRTPLHVIMGFTDVLDDSLEGHRSEATADAIGRIRRASANLLELVDSTLDLSRLDSGRDEPVLEDLSLREFLAETAKELESLVGTKSPRVSLDWLPVEEVVIRTDPRKLRIVLRNLVANALKFTPEGRVEVASELRAERLSLTVRDSGIGIPPDRIGFVFDMFQQGHSGDDRPYGGVGLGLYIVRRLVEQLGGEVRVDSELGRGSTFTVAIPVRGRSGAPAQPENHPHAPTLGV